MSEEGEAVQESIERVDKYTLMVDGVRVAADAEQEAQIKTLSPQEREIFMHIMGGTTDD